MRGRDEGGRDDQGTKGLEDQGTRGPKKEKKSPQKKKKVPKINTSPTFFSDRLKNTQASHFSQWPAFAGGKVWCFRDPSASEDRREHPGTHHLCVASLLSG